MIVKQPNVVPEQRSVVVVGGGGHGVDGAQRCVEVDVENEGDGTQRRV